jgi:hypothetical protein
MDEEFYIAALQVDDYEVYYMRLYEVLSFYSAFDIIIST